MSISNPALARTLAWATAACLALQGAAAQEAPAIALAHSAYYQEQFGRSLVLYEALAATGNPEAAERAGYMLLHGGGAFGPQVPRDVARARVLLAQAAHAGRPGAAFVLNMLERSD